MEKRVIFGFTTRENRSGSVASREVFERLRDLAIELRLIKTTENQGVNVLINSIYPSDAVDRFLEFANQQGLAHYKGSYAENRKAMYLTIQNHFSDRDLDGAEYLYIVKFCELGGNVFGASGCENGVWSAQYPQKSFDWEFAEIYGGIPLVRERLKGELERAGLLGLTLPKLQWQTLEEEPQNPDVDAWQIHSSLLMPPCKNQILDLGGTLAFIEEDFALNARLDFDSDEVRRLGPFDIAMIREKVGPIGLPYIADNPKYVISQRFRQILLANGVTQPSYGVVRLV